MPNDKFNRVETTCFESSQTSGAWQLKEVKQFITKHQPYMIDVSACAVGMRDPESKLLYGKKWRFLTGSRMIALALEKLHCDGRHIHQPVEGSSGGMMRTHQNSDLSPKTSKDHL